MPVVRLIDLVNCGECCALSTDCSLIENEIYTAVLHMLVYRVLLESLAVTSTKAPEIQASASYPLYDIRFYNHSEIISVRINKVHRSDSKDQMKIYNLAPDWLKLTP